MGFGSYQDPVEPKPCLKGLCYSQVPLHRENMGVRGFVGSSRPSNIQHAATIDPKAVVLSSVLFES